MELVKIGKILRTHGLEGYLKVKSDFTSKELLVKGIDIYIGDQRFLLENYRICSNYDLMKILNMSYYDAKKFVNLEFFIKREDIKGNLLTDIIGFNILENKQVVGEVIAILDSGNNLLVDILYKDKQIYVPYQKEFIYNIDYDNKYIEIKLIEGMV